MVSAGTWSALASPLSARAGEGIFPLNSGEIRSVKLRHSPRAGTRNTMPLFKGIDHQPAEKLRIEIRTLGGHSLAGVGDGTDVFERGGHHQRG